MFSLWRKDRTGEQGVEGRTPLPQDECLNVTVLGLALGMTWLSFGLHLFCTHTEVLQVHPLEVHPGFENSRPGTWKSLQRGAEGTWGEEASSPGVRVLPVLNPACCSQGARARSLRAGLAPHVGHTAQPTCSLTRMYPESNSTVTPPPSPRLHPVTWSTTASSLVSLLLPFLQRSQSFSIGPQSEL